MVEFSPIDRIKRSQRADVVEKLKAAGATDEQIKIFMKDKKITQDEINAIQKENAEVTTHTTNELIMDKNNPLDENQLNYLVQQGIVQKNGNSFVLMSGKTLENVQAALQEYADNNIEKPTATFSPDSSEKILNPLMDGENPVLTPKEGAGEKVYSVNDEAGLRKGLEIPDDAVIEKKQETVEKEIKLKVRTTTVTSKNYGAPDDATMRAQNLEDGSVRRECKQQFRRALQSWLADGSASGKNHYQIMNESIAAKSYSKQIAKKQASLAKKNENKPYNLVREYFSENGNATVEEKEMYNNFKATAKEALTAEKPTEKQQKLRQDILNIMDQSNNQKLEHITGDPEKMEQALAEYAISSLKSRKCDIVNIILRQKAMDEVLSARTPEQVQYDIEHYLDYMSEREVQIYRDQNRIANTVSHFSSEECKNAKKSEKDPEKIHNDIGKKGRKLVKNRPDLFCDKLSENTAQYSGMSEEQLDKLGIIKKDGEFYKFNSKKYSDEILSWFNNSQTDTDAGNTHATLSEVRNFNTGSKFFITEGEGTLEELFGNGNGRSGYRETKVTRDLYEGVGGSVDKDSSNLMMVGTVAGKSTLTFAMAFIPGAIAAKTADGLSKVVDVAQHVINIPTKTYNIPGHTIEVPDVEFSGREWAITYDYYYDNPDLPPLTVERKTAVDYSGKEKVPFIVDKNSGKKYQIVDGKCNIEGRSFDVNIDKIKIDGKTVKVNPDGTVTIDGEKIKVSEDPNWFKEGLRTAGIATLLALPINILNSLGIQDKGDTEDVVRLNSSESKVSESQQEFKLQETFETYNLECKKNEGSGFKPCKLRIKHVNEKLNRGETMESMVAQYYGVQVGSDNYNKIYNYVQKFNELRNFGGFNYPTKNIINLPDFIPANITGTRVKRVADPSNPEERLNLALQDIPLANRAVKTEAAKSQAGGESYGASCKVQKQKPYRSM